MDLWRRSETTFAVSFEISGSPFSPPWLVGILLRDLLLLLACLLNVVGVLGFPRLPSPHSGFPHQRSLAFGCQVGLAWVAQPGSAHQLDL